MPAWATVYLNKQNKKQKTQRAFLNPLVPRDFSTTITTTTIKAVLAFCYLVSYQRSLKVQISHDTANGHLCTDPQNL